MPLDFASSALEDAYDAMLGTATISLPDVTPDTVPETDGDLLVCMMSFDWRVFSGRFYKIVVKQNDEDELETGQVLPFIPNGAQRAFLQAVHNRNVILKARQLGFTTLIAILWLDHALFARNQSCGIVCHTLDAAEAIFRDKILFAYDNMPEAVRAFFPTKKRNTSEILFAHNDSKVRVGTSLRSGTYQKMHVSEMGKVAAKEPHKAVEIVTGTFPTVPNNGVLVVESTAEGAAGEFYELSTRAERATQTYGDKLSVSQFKFHFFPWFHDPNYVLDPRYVTITDEDHQYFDEIEDRMDVVLTEWQRAFYVGTRDGTLGGDVTKMWREYPSTPEECWQQSTKGRYYAFQLQATRRGRRIRLFDYDPYYPVHTFWDIGANDGTGIWFAQIIGEEHRFLRYLEGWQHGYAHYTGAMQTYGYTYGYHYLPHDADQKRQGKHGIVSAKDMLESLVPTWHFVIVPQVDRLKDGIEITRKHFAKAVFHERDCKAGIEHLGNYQAQFNKMAAAFTDEPLKNVATEAADSFRQWAQALEDGAFGVTEVKRRRRPSGAAV